MTEGKWLSREQFMDSFDKSESAIYNWINKLKDVLKINKAGKNTKYHSDNIEIMEYSFENWVEAALEKYWENNKEESEVDPKSYFYWIHMKLFVFQSYLKSRQELIQEKNNQIEGLQDKVKDLKDDIENLNGEKQMLNKRINDLLEDKNEKLFDILGKAVITIGALSLFIIIGGFMVLN